MTRLIPASELIVEDSEFRKEFRMRVNYAIVFVSDMKRAVTFYRDKIGLALRFESPGWTAPESFCSSG